jgi:hypothetical protein
MIRTTETSLFNNNGLVENFAVFLNNMARRSLPDGDAFFQRVVGRNWRTAAKLNNICTDFNIFIATIKACTVEPHERTPCDVRAPFDTSRTKLAESVDRSQTNFEPIKPTVSVTAIGSGHHIRTNLVPWDIYANKFPPECLHGIRFHGPEDYCISCQIDINRGIL